MNRPLAITQRGNVRLVIYAVNAMLLDWGEPLFIQIANSYRYWTGTKTRHLFPGRYRKLPAPQKSLNDFNEIRA